MDFAPVADIDDQNDERTIVHRVENALVADADSASVPQELARKSASDDVVLSGVSRCG